MSYWKLSVEEFGKIKKAEIELAPLTLFAGDNNSGKSYLLSLAWEMHRLCNEIFNLHSIKKINCFEYAEIEKIFLNAFYQAESGMSVQVDIEQILPQLQIVINQVLQTNKEFIIKKLFNTDCVRIKSLCLKIPDGVSEDIFISKELGEFQLSLSWFGLNFAENLPREDMARISVCAIMKDLINKQYLQDEFIYMPSARTGFMMAKDIINKYARRRTYDVGIVPDEQTAVHPFSRPILDFLDDINDLSGERSGRAEYQSIASFIQQEMVQGNIEISGLPGREFLYIPHGADKKYPFRVTSAVVTELSPLLLLLSHRSRIKSLFYEEPEMCLHPALQRRIGQVLIRMVNAGIKVMATTHSDIILQHVNNMIRLSNTKKNPENYGYDKTDVIAPEHVRVYQFSNCKDGTTEVKELPCGENGFAVPTFNEALDEMMEDIIQIQS